MVFYSILTVVVKINWQTRRFFILFEKSKLLKIFLRHPGTDMIFFGFLGMFTIFFLKPFKIDRRRNRSQTRFGGNVWTTDFERLPNTCARALSIVPVKLYKTTNNIWTETLRKLDASLSALLYNNRAYATHIGTRKHDVYSTLQNYSNVICNYGF